MAHCHSLSLNCFSKIQNGFTFLVSGYLGSRAIKGVCMYLCVCPFITVAHELNVTSAAKYCGLVFSFLEICNVL